MNNNTPNPVYTCVGLLVLHIYMFILSAPSPSENFRIGNTSMGLSIFFIVIAIVANKIGKFSWGPAQHPYFLYTLLVITDGVAIAFWSSLLPVR